MESRKVIFVEQHLNLLGYIVGDECGFAWRRASIAQYSGEFLLADSNQVAETYGVETLLADMTIGYHQVVALLTVYQELSVAVQNLTTRSILHLIAQYVTFGKALVAAVDKL
jgi:hypothetical protein